MLTRDGTAEPIGMSWMCDTGTIRGGSWVGFRTLRFVLAYIITNEQTKFAKFHLGCEI